MSSPPGVILLAFGPAPVTRAARRRLRGVGELVEVDAGSDKAADQLHVALGRFGERPVLLVHDDVALGPGGARDLLEGVGDGTDLLVPSTNDRGTDHHHGSLPPTRSAAGAISAAQREAAGRPRRPLSRARLACVAGRASELRDPVLSLHDPFVVVTHPRLVHLPTVVAAHDASCADAFDDTSGDLLVATLIVRDEAEMLPGCLASLEGLVDRILVCDTGSGDNTVELARAAGAELMHRSWRNDFAWARNQVADAVGPAAFCLWIDADERVECPDPIGLRRVLARRRGEVDAFLVELVNQRGPAEASTSFRMARLYDPATTCFVGALHEQIQPRGAHLRTVELPGLRFEHLGYRRELVDGRDKGARNLEVAEAAHRLEGSGKTALDLARSLMIDRREPERAVALFDQALEALGEREPASRAFVLASRADVELNDLGRPEAAWTSAVAALALVPADETAAHVAAEAATRRCEAAALVALADELDIGSGPAPMATNPAGRRAWHRLVALARAELGDRPGAWAEIGRSVAVPSPPTTADTAALVELAGSDLEGLARVLGNCAEHEHVELYLRSLATVRSPAEVVALCLAYLEGGGRAPTAVSTGLLAAGVTGDEGAAWRLVDKAALLDADLADQVADRLRRRGLDGPARRLGEAVAPAWGPTS